jgi:hypothetical protein
VFEPYTPLLHKEMAKSVLPQVFYQLAFRGWLFWTRCNIHRLCACGGSESRSLISLPDSRGIELRMRRLRSRGVSDHSARCDMSLGNFGEGLYGQDINASIICQLFFEQF